MFVEFVFEVWFVSEMVDVILLLWLFMVDSGRIYLVSQVIDELIVIFVDMGFLIVEGLDIEIDELNFIVLNFFEGYLVCEMYDMFFFNEKEDGECFLLCIYMFLVQI